MRRPRRTFTKARTPTGLGPGYHRLWTATAISTLGDGVFLAALPLLAVRLTHDPLQVAIVAAAGWLPWLLLGLLSGALVDRSDRRRMMWTVDAVRCAVAGVLAAAVLAGLATIPLLAATGFVLGAGATLFDSAAQSLIPALLGRDPAQLERANGQLLGTQQVTQQLAGPPLGGLLFSLAHAVPFLADAVSFGVSSVLIGTIRGRFAPQRTGAPRTSLRADMAEGLGWLARHRLLRAITTLGGVANLALTAADAILVLFAQQHLGLGSVGYGLLLSSYAVGGVLGSVVATRIGRLLGAGTVIVGGLLVGAGVSFGIGLSSSAVTAGVLLAVQGAALTVLNVVLTSLRQALVPDALLGRVVSIGRLVVFGTMPLGGVLGGVTARALGLRAPFLLGAAVLAAAALLSMPVINNRTIHAARIAAAATPRPDDG